MVTDRMHQLSAFNLVSLALLVYVHLVILTFPDAGQLLAAPWLLLLLLCLGLWAVNASVWWNSRPEAHLHDRRSGTG